MPSTWHDLPLQLHDGLHGRELPGRKRFRRADTDLFELWTTFTLDQVATLMLEKNELNQFKQFRYEKRQQEWLAGRCLAKALALELLQTTGVTREPKNLVIVPDQEGMPQLECLCCITELPSWWPPSLSISHSHGRATAAILSSPTAGRVGIDIEQVRPRSQRFLERVFTEQERTILSRIEAEPPEQAVLGWTLKEATTKALGRGLPQLVPWDVTITSISKNGTARIRLDGPARQRFRELAAISLSARFVLDQVHAVSEVIID